MLIALRLIVFAKHKMQTIKEIKQLVTSWARSRPFRLRVYIFGSFVKGKFDPLQSDLDIAVEFSEARCLYKNELRYPESLWYELRQKWEIDLTKKLGMKVHLNLLSKDADRIQKALKEHSLLVYNPEENENMG